MKKITFDEIVFDYCMFKTKREYDYIPNLLLDPIYNAYFKYKGDEDSRIYVEKVENDDIIVYADIPSLEENIYIRLKSHLSVLNIYNAKIIILHVLNNKKSHNIDDLIVFKLNRSEKKNIIEKLNIENNMRLEDILNKHKKDVKGEFITDILVDRNLVDKDISDYNLSNEIAKRISRIDKGENNE